MVFENPVDGEPCKSALFFAENRIKKAIRPKKNRTAQKGKGNSVDYYKKEPCWRLPLWLEFWDIRPTKEMAFRPPRQNRQIPARLGLQLASSRRKLLIEHVGKIGAGNFFVDLQQRVIALWVKRVFGGDNLLAEQP